MIENKEHAIVINGVYRHFKGSSYYVETIGEDTEGWDNLVIYRERHPNGSMGKTFYARPVARFFENIEGKYPDSINVTGQRERFELAEQYCTKDTYVIRVKEIHMPEGENGEPVGCHTPSYAEEQLEWAKRKKES